MNRKEFKNHFSTGKTLVFPVIHVIDERQTLLNVSVAKEAGCPGVFLINHDFPYPAFLPIIKKVREQQPDYWLGVNFLAVTANIAFPVLAELDNAGTRVDAYWADDARIDERVSNDDQVEARNIMHVKQGVGWRGMYFGGTAFKKQRDVNPNNYASSARLAANYMDVVTTSGIATGHSADHEKVRTFRTAIADAPLALASGVTPDNIGEYLPWVDAVLVATGINIENDFYNIDSLKLSRLLDKIEQFGDNHDAK